MRHSCWVVCIIISASLIQLTSGLAIDHPIQTNRWCKLGYLRKHNRQDPVTEAGRRLHCPQDADIDFNPNFESTDSAPYIPHIKLQGISCPPNNKLPAQSRLLKRNWKDSNKSSISSWVTVDSDSFQVKSIQFPDRVLDFNQLAPFIDSMNHWDWPIFEFSRASHDMPLLPLATILFSQEHLFESLQIPIDKFVRCVHAIEGGYSKAVPYHNSMHAADVLHGCHVLSQSKSIRGAFSVIERTALYFAAIIHDHQHPGFSSAFLIKKGDPVAKTYNKRSILEQFHLATAFEVMEQDDCNFIKDWEPTERRLFRKLVTDLVLATDLKMQAEIITQWKSRMDDFDLRLPVDRHMLLKIIIKASDVANPTKTLPIYQEWIGRIMSEFFQQGDEERRLGLPISPYCDSTQPNIPGSQVGFMTWVVCPLYEALDLVVPIPVQVGQLRANLEYWKSVQLQT